MEHICKACGRSYSTKQNLNQHFSRQPLCEIWMNESIFNSKLVEYVDKHIDEEKIHMKECKYCNKKFASKSNLNKHMNTNVICKKWEKYMELKPLYEHFEPPKYKLCHIIWNVFLIDKEFEVTQEIIDENKIGYILALLPDKKIYDEKIKINVAHNIIEYQGHNMDNMDFELFDKECQKIEEYRKERKNIFVFCNNGYQRSIPFLCHYLVNHHNDEVPTIEKAIDIILPQVDKENYSKLRDKYIENMNKLFKSLI